LNNETAILIFANSAKVEGLNKPFQHAAVLFQELNSEIEAKVKRTKLPYFVISEAQQKGNTFGERFTNAIQLILDKGFEKVITVGNDTPHLQISHINTAYKKLKSNTLVLGPSLDGGFYLIGITKKLFYANKFKNLPWQTSQLREGIVNLPSFKKAKVTFLQTLQDVDTVSDVKTIVDSFRSISTVLKYILLQIITFAKTTTISKFQSFRPKVITIHYNKGSPDIFLA